MDHTFNKQKVKDYVRLNWFKIGLVALIIFTFFKKDISFQFNINNPNSTIEEEQISTQKSNKTEKKVSTKNVEKMTNIIAKGNTTSSFSDYFKNPFSNTDVKKEVAIKPIDLKQVDRHIIDSYLHRFANVVISERKKFGIPSSIILANALLHSAGGQQEMTVKGNNHFAIRCVNNWSGQKGTYFNTCYRHYENSWNSFRDHSLYLTGDVFKDLLMYNDKDYHNWAKGLEQKNYSNIKNLATQLIDIIEEYHLYDLDNQ